MKILIVAATATEINSIKKWIKSAEIKANLDIDYLCSGVWNYETIFSLENYLISHPEPTFIWNIWVCWYWNPNNDTKTDSIQVASIVNIHSEKEIIVPPFIAIEPLRNCFSSENVVFDKPIFSKEIWTTENEMYFDMESRWIGFVASKYKLPYLLLKVPFDFIGKDTKWLYNNKWNFISSWKVSLSLDDLPDHDYLMKILQRIQNNDKS